MNDEDFLRQAIELGTRSAREGGGPFGALVVRAGTVIATGNNQVVSIPDPTAHAEVVALRVAARALGAFLLDGCVVYASCEPCPMCLAAAFWARVERVVYAASRYDAAAAGFDDDALYQEMAAADGRGERSLPVVRLLPEAGIAPFEAWAANPNRVPY
ncbi:MAG: nucleoside deaminase [Acidimicrobiales bacterium]